MAFGAKILAGVVGLCLAGCATVPVGSDRAAIGETARWRISAGEVHLSPSGPVDSASAYLYPDREARETRLTLRAAGDRPIRADLACTAPVRLIPAGGGAAASVRSGGVRDLTIPAGLADAPVLVLGPEAPDCDLTWGGEHRLALRPASANTGPVARIDGAGIGCPTTAAPSDPLLAAYLASDDGLSLTCPLDPGPIRLLPGQTEALIARSAALLGQPLTEAALRAGDPGMALDFSRAPQLDLIVLSYLHIRADFSGYLLARILAHHARRGTEVRIMVTDSLMLWPERRFLAGLTALYPSVQVQYVRWDRPGVGGPADQIDRLQRAHHIKAFVVLARDPARSRAIVGGRNLHDGFFFDTPFDLSDWPMLRSYEAGDSSDLAFYSVYEDFEIELSGQAAVETIAAHLSAYWNRDAVSQEIRPPDARAASAGQGAGTARHFLSLPWSDGRALEQRLVALFDAAEREIAVVTPFLYPTPAIDAAMLRARQRGVAVRIVTRLTSTDPTGSIVSALNRAYVGRRMGDFEILDYVPEVGLLHTKLILIDGRLGIVGSVNLNQRSFLHDTENGVMVLDPGLVARLSEVLDSAAIAAHPADPRGGAGPLDDLLLTFDWLVQYF